MDKPLYILIFLLLWSIRIRGGEDEDINGSFSQSTQKTGVRNSLIDKASTSSITKTATTLDPDSESSETESPPIKSQTLETNTGTTEPSAPIPVTPKPTKEYTIANTTTLTFPDLPDSESSETESPLIKSKPPHTNKDLTTAKTALPRNPDSESSETNPASKELGDSEAEIESSETDAASIKSEAPETEIDMQTPSIYNFESLEIADGSTATTKIPDFELESSETASTVKLKTSRPTTVHLRRHHRSSDERQNLKGSKTQQVFTELKTPSPTNASTTTSTKDHYPVPNRPKCSDVTENVAVSSRTNESITLDFTKLMTEDRICVQRQDEKDHKNCRPAYNTVPFDKFNPSTLYKFSVYYYINDSVEGMLYSDAGCPFMIYTLPNRPKCSDVTENVTVSSRTNESITLNFTKLMTEDRICVQRQDEKDHRNCRPAYNTVPFDKFNPSTLYNFSVYSYINDSVEGMLYSEAGCPFMIYTLPNRPKCSDVTENVAVSSRTNESITLNFTKLMTEDRICVQRQDEKGHKNCKPADNTVPFDKFNSSTLYEFSVYSYINDSVEGKLYSEAGCPFMRYTLPNRPKCSDVTDNVTVSSRTNESITLVFTNLLTEHRICVQRQDEEDHRNCKPADNTVPFYELTPSTLYNFSVYSYINDSVEGMLYSEAGCPFMGYTCPMDPICTFVLVSNKTTNSMILDFKKVQTPGAARYMAEIYGPDFKNTTYFSKGNNFIQHITDLTPGTSYKLEIYALSLQNIKSANSCLVEEYTYPGQPRQPGNFVIKNKTQLHIYWTNPQEGDVDTYNISVECNCRCTPNVIYSLNETKAIVTGLKAGTYCNVSIYAILGQLSSIPLNYLNIETNETVSGEVSNVTVDDISTNGLTISWRKPTEPNGDILYYHVNIFSETFDFNETKNASIALPSVSFERLKPGICYHIFIAAVNSAGEGKQKNTTVYTKETVPSQVLHLETLNASSKSIAVEWSKPQNPNGVITQYRILVRKVIERGDEVLKQQIWLNCERCQTPCSSAGSNHKDSGPSSKNKDGEGTKVITHNASFSESNNTLQYVVTKLEIFTLYNIIVTAFTAVGPGENATSENKTSEDKPSSPGNPKNFTVKANRLSFVYDKPENENGVITKHEIEYRYIPYKVCSENENAVEETTTSIIIHNDDQFYATLKNLQPFWRYTIRVRVSTYAGFSNYGPTATIRTKPSTPNPVSNITVEQNSSRHIYLSWTQPCHPNGNITHYTIEVTNLNESSNAGHDISYRTSFNVTDLLPYRSYNFTVRTQVEGVLQLSDPQNSIFQTSTEAPYRPGDITIENITSSSVTLSWKPPELQTGPTKYVVTAFDNETSTQPDPCETQGFKNTICRIRGLDSYWDYLITVQAIVVPYNANQTTIKIKTKESAPGKVSAFKVTQDINITAKTNVRIKWNPPARRDLNGVIKKYYLQYWYRLNQKMVKSYPSSQMEAIIIVEAEKMYTFQIFASNKANATNDDYVTKHLKIKPGAPLPPPKQKVPLINKGPPASDDQTQIAVAFSRAALCNNSNGEIVKWYIIVSKTPGVKVFRGARVDYSEFIQKTYKKWGDVYEKDVNIPYIASDSWNPHCKSGSRRKRSASVETVSYTLGSDGDCESGNRKYCNGNLEPGQTYRVRYAVCTAGGCLESEFSEPFQTAPNHVPAIAGSLTAVVLVLAAIIVVIIILKRRGKGPFKSLDNGEVGQQNEAFNGVEMKGTSKPKAVKIADFANYVQKLHADSNLLFSSEYKLLKETCPTHTTKAAEVQVNRIKNRYTNILSYDHSRVKLLPTEDDEGSDYINANYMPGYSSPREYIATQGPLPFTRDDFWRMVWEQNVSIIVMLTQLVERGRRKCDIYWPETAREPVYYGDLVVELESESTLPDYVLRVMSIKLGNRVRKVKQLHYLKWPDMGCPETTWLLLNFVGATRLYLPHNDPGPIVVHCSAGVGRTGTFIAVDYLMQHVRTSDVIDIYSYVMKMRNNRPNMVQTEDQYVFIHDCIKDYVNKNDDDTDDEEEEEEKQEDQSIYMNV